jgi:hypothetical protein
VAHACNSSYSGGRDQEDHGLKLAWASSSARPCLEKSFTKIELVEWLKAKALSTSPSTAKKKKKDPTLARQALYHLCHSPDPVFLTTSFGRRRI